jgi:hypothetical protein
VLTTAEVEELVKDELFPEWEKERERLDRIDAWYRWKAEPIRIPRSATPELKQLAELSRVPWLGLVVTSAAQAMYVDGYRSRLDPATPTITDGEHRGPWQTWLWNDMDQRQIAIHRATLAYGHAYMVVLPGEDFMGEKRAVMRGVSPRKMIAVYEDPAQDDWPKYAMQCEKQGGRYAIRVYDDEVIHHLVVSSGGEEVEYVDVELHELGLVPVVRYCSSLDLDGRTSGDVEPFIPLAARINKTSYDRIVTQHFASWKVRTVAGMAEPDDEEHANRKKLRLRQDDILVAEDPDTKFGTLDETPLDGFIAAHTADVESLAAVSQTPTHELTGQLANLSAEALAAARASLKQKVTERQKSIGKSHNQSLRLGALIDGEVEYAQDYTGRVTWQDMEIRSMAQAVDALGKAAQMLGVPVQALWGRIPGVEKSDVEEWTKLALEGDPIKQMQLELEIRAAQAMRPADDGMDDEPADGQE